MQIVHAARNFAEISSAVCLHRTEARWLIQKLLPLLLLHPELAKSRAKRWQQWIFTIAGNLTSRATYVRLKSSQIYILIVQRELTIDISQQNSVPGERVINRKCDNFEVFFYSLSRQAIKNSSSSAPTWNIKFFYSYSLERDSFGWAGYRIVCCTYIWNFYRLTLVTQEVAVALCARLLNWIIKTCSTN